MRMRTTSGRMGRPQTLVALTLVPGLLLPRGVSVGAAAASTPPCACACPGSTAAAAWLPQYPLHRGLHLLPGTPVHDYGALRPYAVSATRTITVPAQVDLSRDAPPMGDQGDGGSGAAWAATYTLVGWYLNHEHLRRDYMAPLYTYRQINSGSDTGTSSNAALQVDTRGMVPLRLYPQGNYAWRVAPTGTQMAIAPHWRVLRPYQLDISGPYRHDHTDPPGGWPGRSVTLPSRAERLALERFAIERSLAAGHPSLVDVAGAETLERATPRTAWIGPSVAPPGGARLQVLVAVGYDAAGLWVAGSRGTSWGLGGYVELSWDYVLDNVWALEAIAGVQVTPGVRLPPAYRGPPLLTATIVTNGWPQRDQTAWQAGEDVVWAGRGFRPGETVSLSWDGGYRSYVTALSDGTWSVEWDDHPQNPLGAHNLHPSPGLHRFVAVGERGDQAWSQIVVR